MSGASLLIEASGSLSESNWISSSPSLSSLGLAFLFPILLFFGLGFLSYVVFSFSIFFLFVSIRFFLYEDEVITEATADFLLLSDVFLFLALVIRRY